MGNVFGGFAAPDLGQVAETDGNRTELATTDDETQITLNAILKELKIMNMHLALMTDVWITRQEVE